MGWGLFSSFRGLPRGHVVSIRFLACGINTNPNFKGISPRASRLRATFFCQARQKKAIALSRSQADGGERFFGDARAPEITGRHRLRRSCRAQSPGLPMVDAGRWSASGSTCIRRVCPRGRNIFDRCSGSRKLALYTLLASQRCKPFIAPRQCLTSNPAPFAPPVEALLGTFEAIVKSTSPASGRSPRGETLLTSTATTATFAPRSPRGETLLTSVGTTATFAPRSRRGEIAFESSSDDISRSHGETEQQKSPAHGRASIVKKRVLTITAPRARTAPKPSLPGRRRCGR